MKKRIFYVIFIFMFFALGCNNNSNNDTRLNYRSIENVNSKKQDLNFNEDAENKFENEYKPIKALTSDKDPYVISDEMTSFKGIISEVETPISGNLSINSKLNSRLSLICPDSENDTIYYVNYGKDNYIYSFRDGVSTLLVDKPTYYIQLWNDEIYFLGYNNENQLFYKNVYKYNISSQKLETLIECNIGWMYINANGIYCTLYEMESENNYITKVYIYYFNSNLLEFYRASEFSLYKDCLLEFVPASNGSSLQLKKDATNEIIFDISDASLLDKTCIYKDYLFYANNYLNIVNLTNGKKYTVNLGYDFTNRPYFIADFILVDDYVYISTATNHIFRLNINDLSLIDIKMDNSVYDLFTDGERIFATRAKKDDKGRMFDLIELILTNYTIDEKELN